MKEHTGQEKNQQVLPIWWNKQEFRNQAFPAVAKAIGKQLHSKRAAGFQAPEVGI